MNQKLCPQLHLSTLGPLNEAASPTWSAELMTPGAQMEPRTSFAANQTCSFVFVFVFVQWPFAEEVVAQSSSKF